jgi:hypothetical protein
MKPIDIVASVGTAQWRPANVSVINIDIVGVL